MTRSLETDTSAAGGREEAPLVRAAAGGKARAFTARPAALFVNGFENEKIVISRSEFQLRKSDRRAH